MPEPIESIYPFDGDPPEALANETEEVLTEWSERFHHLIKEAAAEGITVQVLIGCYDPLLSTTHHMFVGKGDWHARFGLAAKFIKEGME